MKNYKLIYFFLLIFFIIASISVYRAYQNSLILSIDFQYSPSKLLSNGINHYKYVLDGKHDNSLSDKLFTHQNGEYAHGLYVLLLPLALLEWDDAKLIWSVLNIVLSILIPVLLGKKFKLNNIKILICCLLYLSSSIFRINIGWGQQTTFILFFLILPFVFQNNIAYILSGISYFKYNIGYALFIYFLTLKKINLLILSLLPCIAGWIFYSLLSNTAFFDSLFQPLMVVKYLNLTLSFPFFFSFFNKFGINLNILYFISLLINFYYISKLTSLENGLLKLSLFCLSILIFVPHSIQDYILLMPLMIFSIKNINYFISKINLIFIFYYYFVLWLISKFFGVFPWEYTRNELWGHLNIFILLFLFLINFYYFKKYYLKKYKISDDANK